MIIDKEKQMNRELDKENVQNDQQVTENIQREVLKAADGAPSFQLPPEA